MHLLSFNKLFKMVDWIVGCKRDWVHICRRRSKLCHKIRKKISINANPSKYQQQIHSDSIITKVLKIVDETANEFYLEQRTGFYNTEVSERYYLFRQYHLSKTARRDYEYQFLEFSASFFLSDSMFVVEIRDFPSKKQSKLSKQIENAIVIKFETRLEKDAIHRLSKR
ncbi:MAG: hypothetical protein ACREOI_01955 [bacterium]